MENAATALATIDALRDKGAEIPEDAIADGLISVRWPGRLEVLREEPLLIVDGAHNRESARRLREALTEYFSVDRAFFIVGASADKDITGIAEELAPLAEAVFAVRTGHPRAMKPERVRQAFQSLGVPVEVRASVGDAIDHALAGREGSGVTCIVGSLFAAAEAREHLGLAEREVIELLEPGG
jgi:dihydrofolate synthase/folylpolyglutamate synthase